MFWKTCKYFKKPRKGHVNANIEGKTTNQETWNINYRK